jgi:predicted nucleic acid binding AN1-type Zn finger protein
MNNTDESSILIQNNTQKSKKKKKTKKLRCNHIDCKKSLGIMPFTCKCKGQFCSKHRMSSDHDCSFNWHQDAKNQLTNMLMKGKSTDTHGLTSY